MSEPTDMEKLTESEMDQVRQISVDKEHLAANVEFFLRRKQRIFDDAEKYIEKNPRIMGLIYSTNGPFHCVPATLA